MKYKSEINVRVGSGHRPRFNLCLSISMVRSANLEFIYPPGYFPLCVPTSRNAHVCGNKVGSIMCSHIDYSLFFIFGFLKTNLKTKYSNILYLLRMGFQVRSTRVSHSHRKRLESRFGS